MTDICSLGWGVDPWGDGWWGSCFHFYGPEDVTLTHVSHTIERPPVAPRARF